MLVLSDASTCRKLKHQGNYTLRPCFNSKKFLLRVLGRNLGPALVNWSWSAEALFHFVSIHNIICFYLSRNLRLMKSQCMLHSMLVLEWRTTIAPCYSCSHWIGQKRLTSRCTLLGTKVRMVQGSPCCQRRHLCGDALLPCPLHARMNSDSAKYFDLVVW